MDWRQNEREEITMMKDKMTSSLKLNFIMNAILTMSSFIFPLITFPYVSRILMPEGTGTVSFATSVVTYFALFAQLGIPTYGIRACAKVRDDREALTQTAQEIFLINCVMSILTYAVFFAVLFRVPKMQAEKPLFLVISLTIFFNMIGMDWLYKGLERYTYITVTSIIFKFIALLAMFALIHEKSDYVIYGGISIFAASASNVCNLMNVHKYINLKPMGHYQFGRHMQPIMVFFAMSCATTIYTNLDTVMLGFMKSNTDVGYYNAAVKIKNVLLAVVTSLGTVLLPRASYYVEHHEMEKFHEITDPLCVSNRCAPDGVFYAFCIRKCFVFVRRSLHTGNTAHADHYADPCADRADEYYGYPDAGAPWAGKEGTLFRNSRGCSRSYSECYSDSAGGFCGSGHRNTGSGSGCMAGAIRSIEEDGASGLQRSQLRKDYRRCADRSYCISVGKKSPYRQFPDIAFVGSFIIWRLRWSADASERTFSVGN